MMQIEEFKKRYKVVNHKRFYNTVDDLTVNVTMNSNSFHGDVSINDRLISVEHGQNDYLKEFGFILI